MRNMHGDALIIESKSRSQDIALHTVKHSLLLMRHSRPFDAVFLRFDGQSKKEKYSKKADHDINRAICLACQLRFLLLRMRSQMKLLFLILYRHVCQILTEKSINHKIMRLFYQNQQRFSLRYQSERTQIAILQLFASYHELTSFTMIAKLRFEKDINLSVGLCLHLARDEAPQI